MSEIKKNKLPKRRILAVNQLEAYIENPGRFSILILGARGTGKSFWLVNALSKSCGKANYHHVDALLSVPTVEYWEEQMAKAEKLGCMYIKDVEKLSKENQAFLFNALCTTDGSFGLTEKIYNFRIVFSSTMSISILRDSEQYLMHYFFDRIAQLIVKFPDFAEASDKIESDFKDTWEKFKFDTQYPEEIIPWLKEKAHSFHGNFRDLDKLCIIWNNYQRSVPDLSADEILNKVKNDFSNYYRYPEKPNESTFDINFSREKTWENTLSDLRMKFKKWAREEFGSLKKAEKILGVSYRTMERW